MIVLGWRTWLLAISASLIFHLGLTMSARMPAPGDARKSAGSPVSVSGTLASILGAQHTSAVDAVEPTTEITPVTSAPVEAIEAALALEASPLSVAREPQALQPLKAPALRPVDRAVPETDAVAPLAAPTAAAQPVLSAQHKQPLEPTRLESQSSTAVGRAMARPAREPEKKVIEQQLETASKAHRNTPEKSKPQKKPARTAVRSRLGSDRQGAAGRHQRGQRGRSAASAGAVRRYALQVRRRILRNRPSRSGSGRVVIAFALSPRGRLRYARVAQSSGRSALDRAAIAAVRRSAPFPRPPRGAASRQLRFSIAFRFR